MNTKLFLSTFVLIFLAELGDKTQLAAMGQAAGSGGKWTVFAAASAALVLSTLVAVLFGSALTRFVPEKAIKIGAAVLFLIFGVLILVKTLAPGKAQTAVEARPGLLTRLVMQAAAAFEEAAAQDYLRLAADSRDPAVARLMRALAEEEQSHLALVRDADRLHGQNHIQGASWAQLPDQQALVHDVGASPAGDVLRHAIEHEEATCRFYEELARLSTLPALRRTFEELAEAERGHVRRLSELHSGDPAAKA